MRSSGAWASASRHSRRPGRRRGGENDGWETSRSPGPAVALGRPVRRAHIRSHPHGSRHATRPLQRQDGHRETRPDDTRPGPRPTQHSPAPRRSERLLVTKPHLSKVTSGAHPKRRAARSSERWRPNPRTWCVCSSGTAKMTRSREVTVALGDSGCGPRHARGLRAPRRSARFPPGRGTPYCLCRTDEDAGRGAAAEHRQRLDPRAPLFGGSWSTTGRRVLSPPLLGTAPGPAPLCSVPRLWARPPHTAHPAVPAQALLASVQGHLWARGGTLQLSSGH